MLMMMAMMMIKMEREGAIMDQDLRRRDGVMDVELRTEQHNINGDSLVIQDL